MSFSRLADWLTGPNLLVALWLPLVAAAAAVGALRLLGGKDLGGRLASGGAAAGFVLAYGALIGARGVPAPITAHPALYLALLGFLLGVLIDAERIGGRWLRTLVIVTGLGAVSWVAWPALEQSRAGADRNLILAYLAAAALVFVRTTRQSGSALTPPIQLAVASIGVAVIAALADVDASARLAYGLAAAVGGYLLWNWPTARFAPGSALVLGAGLPLLAVAGTLVLYEGANAVALGVLLFVFFSEWIAGQIRLGGGIVAKAARPLLLAMAGLLVVAGALLLARWQAGLPLPFFES